jgi:hypothetical protein
MSFEVDGERKSCWPSADNGDRYWSVDHGVDVFASSELLYAVSSCKNLEDIFVLFIEKLALCMSTLIRVSLRAMYSLGVNIVNLAPN